MIEEPLFSSAKLWGPGLLAATTGPDILPGMLSFGKTTANLIRETLDRKRPSHL